MNTQIKLCSVKDIIEIRHEVLRQGKPISSCHFEGDDDQNTFHFGVYTENGVIGCVTLMKKNHESFNHKNTYQLRGMAVLPNHRNNNIGHDLLTSATVYLEKRNIQLVWCNVRIKAEAFYKKNGFKTKGSEFNIPEIGPHVLMYKVLKDA